MQTERPRRPTRHDDKHIYVSNHTEQAKTRKPERKHRNEHDKTKHRNFEEKAPERHRTDREPPIGEGSKKLDRHSRLRRRVAQPARKRRTTGVRPLIANNSAFHRAYRRRSQLHVIHIDTQTRKMRGRVAAREGSRSTDAQAKSRRKATESPRTGKRKPYLKSQYE